MGATCIEKARICRHCMEELERHWGPDDLNDQKMIDELDCFEKLADNVPAIASTSANNNSLKMFFDNSAPKRIFKAFLEPWEEDCIGEKSKENECRLLQKHRGLRCIDTECGKACTICPSHMRCVEDSDFKGWSVLLIPKGEEFRKDQMDECTSVDLDCTDSIHAGIAICGQEKHISVFDNCGIPLDPTQHCNDIFQDSLSKTVLQKWDDC